MPDATLLATAFADTEIAETYDTSVNRTYTEAPLKALFNSNGAIVGYVAKTPAGVVEVPLTVYGSAQVFAAVAAGSLTIPPNCVIGDIFIRNNAAHAITGGLNIGTTAGDNDVVEAKAVGSSAVVKVLDSEVLIPFFSKTAAQTLFFDAETAWNSASIDIIVTYYQLA